MSDGTVDGFSESVAADERVERRLVWKELVALAGVVAVVVIRLIWG